MFYDRKVKYLDYCENGIRIKGCGVVKVQVRDKSLNMEVMVSGLSAEDTFRCGVLVCAHEQEALEIGEIKIENGKGNFSYQCENVERLHSVADYAAWSGIRIVLGENREIRGLWKIDTRYTETVESVVIDKDCKIYEVEQSAEILQKAEMTNNAAISQKEEIVQKEEIIQKIATTQNIETKVDTKIERGRGILVNPVKKEAAKTLQETTLVRALEEDKWEQLWNIYPHIRPFRDEREYISITPADFVIFTAESYKAVNNSFLLHGFYNYHHLLLTRMERKGEMVYYVGVPGNYFEREKQVAIMFGFESFECQEEPAQAGDFGYYMMRAQL